MEYDQTAVRYWAPRLSEFIPGFFARSPALRGLAGQCAVVLHGSTMLGVDDAFSDLDLWVMGTKSQMEEAAGIAGTWFFSFELEGKKGHFNLEVMGEAVERVRNCDLERIAELRQGRVLADVDGAAGELERWWEYMTQAAEGVRLARW